MDYAEDESGKADKYNLMIPDLAFTTSLRNAGASGRLSDAGKLFDERWCKHRSVTDIAISAKVPS